MRPVAPKAQAAAGDAFLRRARLELCLTALDFELAGRNLRDSLAQGSFQLFELTELFRT